MQGIRTLFIVTMEGMQREKINEGINNSSGIDLMSVIIIINLAMYILSLKMVWKLYQIWEIDW